MTRTDFPPIVLGFFLGLPAIPFAYLTIGIVRWRFTNWWLGIQLERDRITFHIAPTRAQLDKEIFDPWA